MTKKVSKEEFERKITPEDIKILKENGINHWAFDEMEPDATPKPKEESEFVRQVKGSIIGIGKLLLLFSPAFVIAGIFQYISYSKWTAHDIGMSALGLFLAFVGWIWPILLWGAAIIAAIYFIRMFLINVIAEAIRQANIK